MLQVLLTAVHIIVSLVLILVVLLQTGKRADLAGAFGGGGSQTAFGARGAATVLSKITTASAILFMVTSLGLSVMASRSSGGGSALDQAPAAPVTAPAPEETAPDAALPEAVEEETGAPTEEETDSSGE
jgi:preprotein translocase subunit SecG